MKRNLLSLALVLMLGLTLAVPAAAAEAFTDVAPGAYYADAVTWAVDKDITAGTTPTTFSPDNKCTVAQILTFLWRAQGSPAAGNAPFSNVKASDWYAGAAAWAAEMDMVSGTTFDADAPCTRSMAVTYLWKAAGGPAAGTANFSDVPAGAEFAQAVAWAVEKGVTTGTSADKFSPDSVCTRGQIVTFLHRAFAAPAQEEDGFLAGPEQLNGIYRKGKYELRAEFHTPKLSIKIFNTKYDTMPLWGGLSVNGNHAYSDDISILFYEDYLTIELSGEMAHLNQTLGGRYDLVKE